MTPTATTMVTPMTPTNNNNKEVEEDSDPRVMHELAAQKERDEEQQMREEAEKMRLILEQSWNPQKE